MTAAYQLCTRCMMDTTDQDIVFNAEGVCSHCRRWESLRPRFTFTTEESRTRLTALAEQVRRGRGSGKYDSIIGLSGGIDSSYVAYLAAKLGLKPLAVHFDNGWNSEIAVSNIQKIVQKLGFDLYTYVIDWEEFRDLQRAFFKASVIDIEMLSDHAIFASMFRIARENRIKYVLSGTNFLTEHTMPASWYWRKQDVTNLRSIHAAYGEGSIKTFPTLTTLRFQAAKKFGFGQQYVELLNSMPYRRADALETLKREFDWKYYGGKHYESAFTKFYQAYVLPVKFGIDKRRAHYSDLIHNGEMTRAEALTALERPLYAPVELTTDKAYVLKKLGFSAMQFEAIMAQPPRPHLDFKSDQWIVNLMLRVRDALPTR